MIIDGMALWGEQGLSKSDVEKRIAAVPDLIAALLAVLNVDPDDDEATMELADQIIKALNKAGV